MQVNLLFFATLKDIVGVAPASARRALGRHRRLICGTGWSPAIRVAALSFHRADFRERRVCRPRGCRSLMATRSRSFRLSAAVQRPSDVEISQAAARGLPHHARAHRCAQFRGSMLLRPEAGAICIFEGVVRNNSKGKTTRYLEYEGYESMALKKMEEIGMFVRRPGISMPLPSFTALAIWISARRALPSSSLQHTGGRRSMPANTPSTAQESCSHLEEGILRRRRSLGRRAINPEEGDRPSWPGGAICPTGRRYSVRGVRKPVPHRS